MHRQQCLHVSPCVHMHACRMFIFFCHYIIEHMRISIDIPSVYKPLCEYAYVYVVKFVFDAEALL